MAQAVPLHTSAALGLALGLLALGPFAGDGEVWPAPESVAPIAWDFESVATGGLPAGVEVARGAWEIRELADSPAGPRVLVQTAHNHGGTFNLLVFPEPRLADLELRVQLKALEGQEDQGGGLVWRYRDAGNYYIARANPLESNFRVYRVVAGRRQQLQSAPLTIAPGWHSLRITMRGNQIECFFDGKSYLKVADDTFPAAGRIGLWTKADAVTAFDNLSPKPLLGGQK